MLAPATIETVTIADEASLSDAIHVGTGKIVGFIVPTIISAALSFQASATLGGTYRDVYDVNGTDETSIGASTGARFVPAPASLDGVPYLKVRSGLTAAVITQTEGPILIEVVIK